MSYALEEPAGSSEGPSAPCGTAAAGEAPSKPDRQHAAIATALSIGTAIGLLMATHGLSEQQAIAALDRKRESEQLPWKAAAEAVMRKHAWRAALTPARP